VFGCGRRAGLADSTSLDPRMIHPARILKVRTVRPAPVGLRLPIRAAAREADSPRDRGPTGATAVAAPGPLR